MVNRRIALATCLAVFVFQTATFAAFDVPLPLDNQWTEFTWNAGASPVVLPIDTDDIFGITSPPSFITLDVTDLGISGDQFKVFLDGVDIGETSLPTADGDFIGFFPDDAFADPTWSSGTFNLGPLAPGTHELAIQVIRIPPNDPDGLGAVRARPTPVNGVGVPEPHAAVVWSVLLSGLFTYRLRVSR